MSTRRPTGPSNANITTCDASTATGSSSTTYPNFCKTCLKPLGISPRSRSHGLRGYNEAVELRLRDFRQQEFEDIVADRPAVFAPGISYSRLELADIPAPAAAHLPWWRNRRKMADRSHPALTSREVPEPADGRMRDSSLLKQEAGAAATSSPSMCCRRLARSGSDRNCCEPRRSACVPLIASL